MNGLKTGMALAALALMPLETRAQEAADPAAEALPEITYEDAGEEPAFLHSGLELTAGLGANWYGLPGKIPPAHLNMQLGVGYRFAWKANWKLNATDEDALKGGSNQLLVKLEYRENNVSGLRHDGVLDFSVMGGGTMERVRVMLGGMLESVDYPQFGDVGVGPKIILDYFITPHLFVGLDFSAAFFIAAPKTEQEDKKQANKTAREKDEPDEGMPVGFFLNLYLGYAF